MSTAAAPRLTRAQSREQTRLRLIESAMRVFARDGYAGASVNAIAEAAGYTVGALYSNFATKDDLFLAAFEQHCAGELAALEELIAGTNSWTELLAAVTERFAELDEQQREWWMLWAELWLYGQRHPQAADRLAAVQAATRAAIGRALAMDGEGGNEVAAAVHALWTGFMLTRLTAPDTLDANAFSRAATWLHDGPRNE